MFNIDSPEKNRVKSPDSSDGSSLKHGTATHIKSEADPIPLSDNTLALSSPLFAFFVSLLLGSLGVNIFLFYKVRKGMKYQQIRPPQ
jgi:hypothetical protein